MRFRPSGPVQPLPGPSGPGTKIKHSNGLKGRHINTRVPHEYSSTASQYEYLHLLNKHEIEFDPKYVWD